DLRIVSFNQRFVEVWRIPQEIVPSIGGRRSVPDGPILSWNSEQVKDSEGFLRRINELNADPSLDDHGEIELKDGRTLERRSTILQDAKGNNLGRVWFFRDITARKQAEGALQKAKEDAEAARKDAEAASRAKS